MEKYVETEKVKNLKEAFYETYRNVFENSINAGSTVSSKISRPLSPEQTAILSLGNAIRLVIDRNDFRGFTSEKGAREFIASIGRDEFIDELCYRYLNSFQSINEIPDAKIREAYYTSNHANKGHRETMKLLREELINNDQNSSRMIRKVIEGILEEILFSQEATLRGMKNIVLNLPNMVKYTGAEKRYYRRELELGEMSFVSDIGRRSKTQENAVLLMHNYQNPDLKMMVLADGEGDGANGERASEMAIELSRYWFNELDLNCFSDTFKLEKELEKLIEKIRTGLENLNSKSFREAGTTFTCVIKGEQDTIIANIGDNRVYAITSKGIEQLTKDDTRAYGYYEIGDYSKNVIGHLNEEYREPQRLGTSDLACSITLVSNSDIGTTMLTTSGVTDLIDLENDPDLMVVCKETPREELSMRIARYIADKAYSTTKMPGPELMNGVGFSRDPISGGQRNATVVVDAEKEVETEVGAGEKLAEKINHYLEIEGLPPEKIDKLGKGLDKLWGRMERKIGRTIGRAGNKNRKYDKKSKEENKTEDRGI